MTYQDFIQQKDKYDSTACRIADMIKPICYGWWVNWETMDEKEVSIVARDWQGDHVASITIPTSLLDASDEEIQAYVDPIVSERKRKAKRAKEQRLLDEREARRILYERLKEEFANSH